MMSPRPFIAALLSAFLMLHGCHKEQVPDGIMSDKEMVPIVKDMQIGYAGVDQTTPNARERNLKYGELNQAVLQKHGVDADRFYKSFEYFESKPVLMDTLLQQVIGALNADLDSINKQRKAPPVMPKPKLP